MKRLISFAVMLVCALGVSAQQYSNDATLIEQKGMDIVVEASGSGRNTAEAKERAVVLTLNTLIKKGLEGFNNHTPLYEQASQAVMNNVRSEAYYSQYVDTREMEVTNVKVSSGKKVLCRMTIHYQALKENLEKSMGGNKPLEGPQGNQMPTLTVVPYAKDGEDINALLDNDPWLSYTVTKLSSSFGNYGYKVKDYQQLLKLVTNNAGLTADGQKDYAALLIENAMADIVVTARPLFVQNARGQKSASLEIKASETMTASSLSQEAVNTPFLNNKTPQMLIDEAIEIARRNFFGKLKTQFFDMVQNGREIGIQLAVAQGLDWDFDQDAPNGKDFQEQFGEWLDNNTKSNDLLDHASTYAIRGNARIATWNHEKGKAYKISDFSREMRKFLNECMKGEYEVKVVNQGQNIVVNIK